MRNLILSLFIFFGCSANAQHEIDADVCTKFVHSKINELNVKIWNAVHSGEIVAYTNYSLASTKNSDEIYTQTALKTTVMVSNPENPDDPYDLIPVQVFELFEFERVHKISVIQYQKDVIINFKKGCLMSFGLVSSEQCERDIYYSLGKSKKLIKKTDSIVLETLLTEIIT